MKKTKDMLSEDGTRPVKQEFVKELISLNTPQDRDLLPDIWLI